jgi:hypothetical protein
MNYVLFALTAPFGVIVGWGWLALLFCIGAVKDFRWEPTLVLTAVFRDWVVKPRKLPWVPKLPDGTRALIPLWRYSTTLCRAIAYQPNARAPLGAPMTRTQQHEHVHVRQSEDRMAWMFLVGLVTMLIVGPVTGDWGLAVGLFLGLWFSGGLSQLMNMLTAVMRRGDVYRDAEHELSAYAQTDPWGPNGENWLDWKARQKR